MARRDANGVRLISRNGNDVTSRFPLIATAVAALPARSCLIDGEAIVRDKTGLAVFDLIRGYRSIASAVLCAFDLLELDGEDLRRKPIESRKSTLNNLLRRQPSGIVYNQHYKARVRQYFAWHVSSVARASCRSGSALRIAQADLNIG